MKTRRPSWKFFVPIFLFLLLPANLDAGGIDYYLTGSVNDGNPIKDDTFFIRLQDSLCLQLIHSVHETGQTGKEFEFTINWYRIKPVLKEYSNLWSSQKPDKGNIHLDPIEYDIIRLNSFTNKNILIVNEFIIAEGPGTYYFAFETMLNNDGSKNNYKKFTETEILQKKNSGQIVQVVVRPDDSYIGYLSELVKTPFIIAPMVSTDGLHQTDCRVGSDCAAFAIYGKRRQGFKIPYVGPRGIFRYLNPISSSGYLPAKYEGTDRYIDRHGTLVNIGEKGLRPGDIVHFGEQVSVFFEDKGIPGILDKDDLLIQSYRPTPHISTMAQSGFYHKPIKIFRWKQ